MIVDGITLLTMIRDGEIKENTKLKDNLGEEYIYKDDGYGGLTLYKEDALNNEYYTPDYSFFTDKDITFEILSEQDEEIDIEAITYFDEVRDLSTWSNETLSDNQRSILIKIKELTKAVKQLNKKIK